jgi:hypothetical protein
MLLVDPFYANSTRPMKSAPNRAQDAADNLTEAMPQDRADV